MQIVREKISKTELKELAKAIFGSFVKAVVDIDRNIMTVGGDLHADEEQLLLEDGSKQKDLWGINIYPEKMGEESIEFDSMINVRPSQDNRSRGVEDAEVQKKIIQVVQSLVE